MKAPYRIGLPPNLKALYIERHSSELITTDQYDHIINEPVYKRTLGYWLLPLSTNPDRTLGEFLKLYDNGKIERVTLRPDDDDVTVLIKPEDRNC
jgi:hypothetical protein